MFKSRYAPVTAEPILNYSFLTFAPLAVDPYPYPVVSIPNEPITAKPIIRSSFLDIASWGCDPYPSASPMTSYTPHATVAVVSDQGERCS